MEIIILCFVYLIMNILEAFIDILITLDVKVKNKR